MFGGMPFLGLAFLSLIGSVATFALATQNGGAAGGVVVNDQVFTGTTLYAVATLLLAASAFFVVAALLRALRRIALLIAAIALASTGGLGALSGTAFTDYVKDHACDSQKGEIAEQCKSRL